MSYKEFTSPEKIVRKKNCTKVYTLKTFISKLGGGVSKRRQNLGMPLIL